MMREVVLGATGARVSHMCLGTMMFGDRTDEPEARRILDAALDAGVTFLDTAAKYVNGKTEEILGRALNGRRDSVFLVTKVWERPDRVGIIEELEKSLRRLRTERVDLYLIHWPRKGMNCPEMMETLNECVRAGKTRFVGCSNFPAWLFAHCNAIAERNGWARLVNNQVPYNPVERGIEVEILPQARAENIAVTCYRPLLAGLLAGKYDPDKPLPDDARSRTDERIPRWLKQFEAGVRKLLAMAKERGRSPSQIAIAWVKAHPAVTSPIVGVSRFEQLREALGAFDFDLAPEEREALSAAFNSPVREESGGNFAPLRRELDLIAGR